MSRSEWPLGRLAGLALPVWPRLALGVLSGAATVGCAVALMGVSAWLITTAAGRPPIITLTGAIVAVRALALGRGVLRYGERLAGHDAAFRVLADLRVTVYRRLTTLAPAGLEAFRSGDLLARMISDIDALQDLFLRCLTPPAVALLVGGVAVGVSWAVLPGTGVMLAAGLSTVAVVVPMVAVAASRFAGRRTASARAELSTAVLDLHRGAAELIVYGAVPAAMARATAADAELTRVERSTAAGSGAGAGLNTLASGLTIAGVLAVGLPAVHSSRLSGVALSVVALTALAAFEAVAGVPAAVQQLGPLRAAAGRVLAVLDAVPPIVEPVHPRPLEAGPHTLRVEHGGLRYTPDGPPALEGVDLTLRPGRRVAVVGPSGAGKTSLLSALLRFRELSEGRVTLDGHELGEYAGDDIRTVVGACMADAHLFHTTIADNLRVARPSATQGDLVVAARRARLLDWITSLPAGWETGVGEGGAQLSGGQRQRIALARAVLADFPVLLLDEPTEGLDEPTAAALTTDLLIATQGRAVLLVTHRLAGLEQVDEILVLEAGHVVQRGTHVDLLAVPGPYRRSWELETGATFRSPDPSCGGT